MERKERRKEKGKSAKKKKGLFLACPGKLGRAAGVAGAHAGLMEA